MIARLVEAPRAPFETLDAIVVLGAPLAADGALTPILEERVAAAAALYRMGGGTHVVATGGVTHGAPRAEAVAIAEALRAVGVPDVIVEDRARTTADNARFTAQLLAPLGVRRVWLVTQPFHGRRAALLFRRAGLEPRVWHIADSLQYRDRARQRRWVVRELGAWVVLGARTLVRRG
ncbi:MAG: YdcF family protein [Deltaproteobacteria bacterium]|nr:YdcF family protein [Deltaproteobacteria bacterium]